MRLLNLHASTLNNFCRCIQYMHANGRIYYFEGRVELLFYMDKKWRLHLVFLLPLNRF